MSLQVYAQSVGRVSYGGTGCPQGTLSYSYLSSSKELVLNYRNFYVRSGVGHGNNLDRKACAITVPVQIPSGYQIALASRSTGSVSVQTNGMATLHMETFYSGTEGISKSRVYRAGQYRVDTGQLTTQMTWSPCSQSTNLRMNLSAVTQQQANINLRQLRLKVLLRRCH